MSTKPFTIKRGDLEPPLPLTLTDGDDPVDLSAATTVTVLGKQVGGTKTFGGTLAERPVDGVLSYDWVAGDTDVPGTFHVEVEVTWPGSRKQTFPPDGYAAVRIGVDLG